MSEQLSLTEARARLDSLIRQASQSRSRVTITDQGRAAAVLISAQELADLDEAVALADFRAQQAAGIMVTVAHDDVRARLGLPRE
jgi:prevent-host-death family protein